MNNRFYRASALISAFLLAFSMAGCGSSGQTIYDPNAQSSSQAMLSSADASKPDSDSVQSQDSDSAEPDSAQDGQDYNLDELTSGPSKYPLRNWINHINAADDDAESGILNLVEQSMLGFTGHSDDPDAALKLVDDENLPFADGKVQMDLNLLMYPYHDNGEYTLPTSMVLTVNGKVYDFSVDGKKSQNGVLTMEVPVDQDLVLPFDMSGVPVQAGENELTFWIMAYSPATELYLANQCFTGYFQSDKAYDGDAPADVASEDMLKGITVETTDGKTKEQIMGGVEMSITEKSNIVGNIDGDRFITVKASAPLSFPILNQNVDQGPSNRSGLCIVLSNGKPLPAFGGKTLADISLKDTELIKNVPYDHGFHAGDAARIDCCLLEYENDKLVFDSFMGYNSLDNIKFVD